MQTTIKSIAAGKVHEYSIKDNTFLSAYKKDIFLETYEVTSLGIVADKQASKEFHGRVDAAIHVGSTTHFEKFKNIHNKELDRLSISKLTIKDLNNYMKTPPKEDKKLVDTLLNTPTLAQAYKDDFSDSFICNNS